MTTPPRFTLTVPVPVEDIDRHGHLNNVAYVRLVQDVATAHWHTVSTPELRREVAWFVRRHEIDYHKPIRDGDALELITWVGEPTAATWERFVEIRTSDGTLMASARTVWVLVDATTARPKRIDAALKGMFTSEAGA
jgi:acyl-CoA thioester hydrolase